MSQKWNLQDIRPAGSSGKRVSRSERTEPRQDIAPRKQERSNSHALSVDPDLASIDIINGNSSRRKRVVISIVLALTVLVAGYFVNVLLGGAEITVYPKYKDSTVQATFSAHKEPQVNELGYELLTLEASSERQVSASGEEEVSLQATGLIFIYNTYSTAPQRLIKNTRFETADGLIFRINESVEIPGRINGADGTVVPGVVTAEVFADGTGEQYNVPPSRFHVPGLKDTDQYDKIYAESTESMSGGFEGKRFIIEESELQTAKQALHLELRDALLKRLEEEKPAGFILYSDAVTFAFDSLPSTEYGDELATIKERARLQVPIFKATEFATYLARNTVAGYEGQPVMLDDPYTLTFTYVSSTTTTSDISGLPQIEFNLSGTTRIIWTFDESKLQSDLVGLSKTALPSVLSGYPAIERAEAVVRPFWKQSFPESASEISVNIAIGNE